MSRAPLRLLCLVVVALLAGGCGYRIVAPGEATAALHVRLGVFHDPTPGARLGVALQHALSTALGPVVTAHGRTAPELSGRVRRLDAQPLAFADGVRQLDEVIVQASLELRDPEGRLLWLSGPVERRAARTLAGAALESVAEDQRAVSAAVDELARALAARLLESA